MAKKKDARKVVSKIMIIAEKHGTTYIDASTEEKHKLAAISVIKSRFGPGGDLEFELETPEEPKVPEIQRNKISELPTEKLRKTANEEWDDYKRKLSYYKEQLWRIGLIKDAMNGDGEAAIDILELRSDYEYELYSIEDVYDRY